MLCDDICIQALCCAHVDYMRNSENVRGDWTPLELFLAGVGDWEAGLRRILEWETILHSARSETLSNTWKLRVMREASLSLCLVDTWLRVSCIAVWKLANVAW
jgi:hypothetical protein